MICCDQCDDWYHAECMNTTKFAIKQSISMTLDQLWFCDQCLMELSLQEEPEEQNSILRQNQ